jgi:hypothetical protein
MTEADWLDSQDPDVMLTYLSGKVSDRKRYLFACACWRRVLVGWPQSSVLTAVTVGEKYADGLATEAELSAALADEPEPGGWRVERVKNVVLVAWAARTMASISISEQPLELSRWNPLRLLGGLYRMIVAPFTVEVAERVAQADLLRHIAGNPFRPASMTSTCPEAVQQLAAAVYAGEELVFALHDALLDAGHGQLAEHFQEPQHPKGCWALDLILDKS